MTFSSFLFIGLIILCLLCLLAWGKRNFTKDIEFGRACLFLYLIILTIFGCFAVLTVNNYLYPKDTEVYDNTFYHILEHTGFSFDNHLNLVSPESPLEGFPNHALWDSKTGNVNLSRKPKDSVAVGNDSAVVKDSVIVRIEKYYEPFFVSKKDTTGQKPFKDYFTLVNNLIDLDVSQGFELRKNNTLKFKFTIEPYEDKKVDKAHYISTIYSATDTTTEISSFEQQINRSYPLMDILQRTPNFNLLSNELQQIFEQIVLVRQEIEIDDWRSAREARQYKYKGKKKKDWPLPPLRFFPLEDLIFSSEFSLSSVAITDSMAKRIFTDTLPSGFRFYSGA